MDAMSTQPRPSGRTRRTLPHRHPGPSPHAEAQAMLEEVGRALDTAIIVRDVTGIGPVTVTATLIYGRVSLDVTVEGETESGALRELARKAIGFRGQDQQWFLRYGLGMG